MPIAAIVIGILLVIAGIGGALALDLFWILVTAAGVALIVWGGNRLGWYSRWRGPRTY